MLSNTKRKLSQIQNEEFAISQNKRVKLEGFILYFVQETPVRKYSVPILPRTRKLSVLENYTRTENPFVIAKKTSIINNKVPEIIPEDQDSEDEEPKIVVEKSNRTLSRRQSAYTLPITSPIKTRQRSNTISLNIPPNLVENETEEFVDVRDEILLMKDQFDKLVAVLDDDLLPTSNSPTPSENSQKYVKIFAALYTFKRDFPNVIFDLILGDVQSLFSSLWLWASLSVICSTVSKYLLFN